MTTPLHPTTTINALLPRYVTRFACIGERCEDTCCAGWLITLDKPTFDAYQGTSHPELKPIFLKHVKPRDDADDNLHYGKITLDRASLRCPAMSGGLCGVQKHLGADLLSNTCHDYPRQTRGFGGQFEQGLVLSCPEAARQALLHQDAFDFVDADIAVRMPTTLPLESTFDMTIAQVNEVRIFCLQLMRDTGLALWERLAVLGVFCESLDAMVAAGQRERIPALLAEFRGVLAQGSLVDALRTLQPNHEAQAMVFATLMAENGFWNTSPIQAEVVQAIGEQLGADETGATSAAALVAAYRRGLARLDEATRAVPWLLDHYVLNEMFLNVFPFHGASPFDAYLRLVAAFGLLRLQLAARCNNEGELPGADALVHTVHVYCRRFQHQADLLQRVNDALRGSEWSSLDKLYGFLRA